MKTPPLKKTLLWIDDIVPIDSLGAGYPRARAIVLMAAEMGWNVIIYPLLTSGLSSDEIARSLPSTVKFVQRGGERLLLPFLQKYIDVVDTIIVSRPHNMEALNRILMQAPNLMSKCRLVYDCEAVYAHRDILAKKLLGITFDEAEELNLIKSEIEAASIGMNAIACVSLKDVHIFQNYFHNEKQVFELNLPLSVVQNTPEFKDRHGLLFVGRLQEKNSPNAQGLRWFIETVWPLIRAKNSTITLTVIGIHHPDMNTFEQEGIRWVGRVKHLQPYYDRARVFIAPVFLASGIPLKILNAVAGGIPVIGTEKMAELLQWPPNALPVANSKTGFADAVLNLYENSFSWNLTRNASKALVEEHYSVAKFKANLKSLLGPN
jgi:glycosyltransferase involved in cell wall biosynthesis